MLIWMPCREKRAGDEEPVCTCAKLDELSVTTAHTLARSLARPLSQDPKTVIRVKASGETLATWEAEARVVKWEAADKGNDDDRTARLGAAGYVRGAQQAQRTQAALETLLGPQVMKVPAPVVVVCGKGDGRVRACVRAS